MWRKSVQLEEEPQGSIFKTAMSMALVGRGRAELANEIGVK